MCLKQQSWRLDCFSGSSLGSGTGMSRLLWLGVVFGFLEYFVGFLEPPLVWWFGQSTSTDNV